MIASIKFSLSKKFISLELEEMIKALKRVNEQLWEIEDNIRVKEKDQDFGGEFLRLARSVYITNDQRAELKRQINILTGSFLIEEKSYSGD